MRALYPSLHLNLAADYVKLGRPEAARTHLRRARGATGALADDSYGDGVRAAIGRLELRLRDSAIRRAARSRAVSATPAARRSVRRDSVRDSPGERRRAAQCP